jgi:RNA polymerase sigma-70 factor (ECF subfamily)
MTTRFPRLVVASAGSVKREVPNDETELVRAASRGSRPAFEALYMRYARMVHGILLSRVTPSLAEDLVQDVFLTAFRKVDTLRSADAFPSWLAAIARNRASEHHRASRQESDALRAAQVRDVAQPDGEAFETLDIIRQLPEAYRETLILRLVEGMTGPEIAERTGLTPDSVRVNLFRGMKLLRERLGGGDSK